MGSDTLVVVVASRPALAVALDLDRNGQPFVPVWGYHGRLQIGPVVAPGGPCFECFEARERQHATNLPVHDAIREYWLRAVVPPPTAGLRALTKIAATEIGLLHNAITKDDAPSVPDHLLGVVRRYGATGEVTEGRVVPMHGCPCGKASA
jgi:bacteriocin biosynthesis cyclodehydratase domain-containing protein